MFKKFRKKVIHSQMMVDLREYTPEALSNIKLIKAVGTVILPENPGAEFMFAFSKIKCEAVGTILRLPIGAQIYTVNGVQVVSNLSAPEGSVCKINGIAVLTKPQKRNVKYIVNGLLLKNKGVDVECIATNGLSFEMAFDEDKVKIFSNSVEIDSSFIRNAEENTLIVAGNKIEIAEDVTEQEVIDKNIRFFAGNSVICSKNIKGCVQNRACVGNKVIAK